MTKTKRRTGAEIIATHLCWDIRDVTEGRYQRYSPSVYVIGNDYMTCPVAGQPPAKGFEWKKLAEYHGRTIYEAKGA